MAHSFLFMKKILEILFLVVIINGFLFGQDNFIPKGQTKESNQILKSIFDDIEISIRDGDASRISKYLGPQTYFSLSNGVNGYYSANQAYYILEDYFNIYKVTSFKLNQFSRDKSNPYATGLLSYDNKGKRNTAKVYISLKKIGDKWNITQLTIN